MTKQEKYDMMIKRLESETELLKKTKDGTLKLHDFENDPNTAHYSAEFLKCYKGCYDISELEGMILCGVYSGNCFRPSILEHEVFGYRFFVSRGIKGFWNATFSIEGGLLKLKEIKE